MCTARRTGLEGVSWLLLFVVFVAATPSNTAAQSWIPIFTKQPTDQTLRRGSQVTLECAATVDSGTVTYSWSFNSVRFDSSVERTYAQDGTLTFELTEANVGEYACLVGTPQGTLTSRQAVVQIAELTRFNLPDQEVVMVTEDSNLTLSCNDYSSVGQTVVRWEMFDTSRDTYVQIPFSSNTLIVGERDFILYFRAVQAGQEGRYRCRVENNDAGEFQSGTFDVRVTAGSPPSPPPPLLSHPQNMTVVAGQRAIFQCIPSGSSVPVVEWFDSVPGEDRFMPVNSYTIFVTNVSTSDSGVYGCRVNGTEYTAYLTVIDPPQVTLLGSTNYTVPYGDALSLQCSASASGEGVTWSWFSDGAKLLTDTRGNVTDGLLSLGDTVLMDSGFYQCFATNSAGSSFGMATVRVITIPPQFTDEGRVRGLVAFKGETLTLTCSADSAPPATYMWLKDGSAVESSPGLSVRTDGNVGQLVILNVTSEFVGNYTCMARATLPENGTVIGEVSSSGEVRVVAPTVFTSMTVPLVYRQVKDNPQPIVLDCAVDGDEVAIFNMTWLKNGVPVSPSNSTVLTSSSKELTLTFQTWSQSDSGEYRCHVSTSLMGFNTPASTNISYVTNVTIATEPAPPVNARGILFNDSARQIQLSWEYLGDRDFILSYTLYRQQTGTPSWIFVTTISDTAVTSYRDTGLFPFTEYRFRVDVTDKKGQSATAYSILYKTPEAAPTASPIAVSSSLLNNSSLRISWQPPPVRNSDGSGRNGIITAYEIRHRVPSSGNDFSMATVRGIELQIILPGTELEVQIAASTSRGQGPFTTSMILDGTDEPPSTAAPFYQELWFIIVVSVAGLIVVASLCLIACICCITCRKLRGRKRSYDVPFRGGDQPNFDVYQYEMEKSTRLRNVQPAVLYPEGQVAIDDSYLGAVSYSAVVEDGYVPNYGPPVVYHTMNGRVGSLEWEAPPPPPPMMFGPQRAKSLEWDPRHNNSTEWSEPESTRGLLVDNRLDTTRRPSEWTEYADEVFSGHQVEVVHVGIPGSDSNASSVEKQPPSASEEAADDDAGSQANSFAASSTFV